MYIVVASSSSYRQATYREALEKLGHRVETAGNGVECVEVLHAEKPDLLVLEAPLQWGGSDGVLDVLEQDLGPHAVPVIVLAVGSGSIDWFQLSRFRIDDFLFRVPTMQELGQAIDSVASQEGNGRSGKQGFFRQSQERRMKLGESASSSTWKQAASAASAAVLQR
jgi:DNA-binding NtrC family response regulator